MSYNIFSKEFVGKVIIASLILSTGIEVNVPKNNSTVLAASVGSISALTVPTVSANSTGEALGTIKVSIPNGSFTYAGGSIAVFTLPNGFHLPTVSNDTYDFNQNVATVQSDTYGQNYIYATGFDTNTINNIQVKALNDNQIQITMPQTIVQTGDSDFYVYLGDIAASNALDGTVNVAVSAPTDSGFPSGTVTVGNVTDSSTSITISSNDPVAKVDNLNGVISLTSDATGIGALKEILKVDNGNGSFIIYTDNTKTSQPQNTDVVFGTMVLVATSQDGNTTRDYIFSVPGQISGGTLLPVPTFNIDPSNTIINGTNYKSFTINGHGVAGAKVSIKASSSKGFVTSSKTATVGSNGTFSVTFDFTEFGSGGEITFTAYQSNSQGLSDKTTFQLKTDFLSSGAPIINPVTDTDTTVTGKSMAGTTITVKAGSTTLGTATAGSNGTFSVTIPAQTAGTVLTVTATDSTGNAATTGTSSNSVVVLSSSTNQDVVTFNDPNLEAAVRSALNKPTGDITKEDMAGLTQLKAENNGIKDLTGLQFATNLQQLDLAGNQISDILPLTNLTNLHQLLLYNNQINDISPLKNLTNLQVLWLAGTKISDISPLTNLTNLQVLWLDGTPISDISPLTNLTSLQQLALDNNQISDISALANLTNLQVLWLENNNLNISTPSTNTMQEIQTFINDGVNVLYQPQNTTKGSFITALTVPTVSANSTGEALGTIRVSIPNGAFTGGDTVTFTLPNSFNFLSGNNNGFDFYNGIGTVASDVYGKNYIYVDKGLDTNTINNTQVKVLDENSVQITLPKTVVQTGTSNFYINLGNVAASDASNGMVQVTFSAPILSAFPTGTVTVGNVADSTLVVAPTVNSVTDSDTTVTGTATAGTTITVKSGNTTLGTATTGSDGSFNVTIPKLTAGTVLSVTATDSAGNVSQATNVTVNISVSGSVVDSTYIPVNNLSVMVTNSTTFQETTKTNSSGIYSFILPKGTYDFYYGFGSNLIIIKHDMQIQDSQTNLSDVVYSNISDTNFGFISGQVKDNQGNPFVNYIVSVTPIDQSSKNITWMAYTDEKGKFSVGGIPTGSYHLKLQYNDGPAVNDIGDFQINKGFNEVNVNVIDAPKVNPIKDTDNSITGEAEAGSIVTVKSISSKGEIIIGSGIADSTGAFSIPIVPQTTKSFLVVTYIDAKGNISKDARVIVSHYGIPIVNSVSITDKVVTGKADPGYTVTVKNGNSTIGTITVNSDGTFSIPLPAQTAGTVLNVTETDSIGNVSSPTSVTVENTSSGGGSSESVTNNSTSQTTPLNNNVVSTTTNTTRDNEGRTVVTAIVDDKQLTDLINQQIKKQSPANSESDQASVLEKNPIVVQVNGQGDQIQTQIASSTFTNISNKQNTVIAIKSDLGTIAVPAASLMQAIKNLGIETDNSKITFTAIKVDSKTELNADNVLTKAGATSLGITPVDFNIQVTDQNGKNTTISNFKSYIGHSFDIPSNSKDLVTQDLAGVMIDPQNNTFYPLPTIFTNSSSGTLQGTILRKGNSIYTVVEHNKSFYDVTAKNYAKDAIDTLASKFVLNGYNDGTYKPNQHVTRAEFTTMLTRALGILPDSKDSSQFTDVKRGEWFAGSVISAVKAGLVNGYQDNIFKPNQEISRQEMLQMIYNAMKSSGVYNAAISQSDIENTLRNYTDQNQVQSWAREAEAVAIKEGITSGVGNDQLAPNVDANREQSASFIYRMMKRLHLIN